MDIVVTIHGDGSLETVLKDSAFDTRAVFNIEARKIDRISEIVPTDDGMRFFIRWLRGPQAGTDSADSFPDYESAVAEEVRQINATRLAGASYSYAVTVAGRLIKAQASEAAP